MPGILISGPAGGAKSQLARGLLREATEPTVQADFQSIVVALLALVRDKDGLYPVRPDFVLPIAEYTRQGGHHRSDRPGNKIIATNSDGDPGRRRALLERLGAGATERIVDPGQAVVEARLSDARGELSSDCSRAVGRWYGRVG